MASAFQNLAPRVMRNLISDFALTVEQAAGVVGNLGAESGLQAIQEARPTVAGSRGGFGWAQWTGARRVAFEKWARERLLDMTSYEANYGYLRAELSGSVPGFDYSHTVAQLKLTTTIKAATETFESFYEKAGILAIASRLSFANQAFASYNSNLVQAGSAGDKTMPETPSMTTEPPKPWYQSKAVIGGILAIVLPLLGTAVPALRLVDPNSAADMIMKVIQIAGPVIGGVLAIFGRVTATQQIGSKATPAPQATRNSTTLPLPDQVPGIMGMPLISVLNELPAVFEALDQVRNAISGTMEAQQGMRPQANMAVSSATIPMARQSTAS